jgi:hypothetical protein
MIWVRVQSLVESWWSLLLMLHHVVSINNWVDSEVFASCCSVNFSMRLLSRFSVLATWLSGHSGSFIWFSDSLSRLETKINSARLALTRSLGRVCSNRILSPVYFNICLAEWPLALSLARCPLSISWSALIHPSIIWRETWLSASRAVVLSSLFPWALSLLHL